LTGTAASRGSADTAAPAGVRGVEVRDAIVQFPVESALAARLRRREPLKVTALDGVSLSIGPRSSLGIVGESGCGKSTLARVLVGLVPLTSGSLVVDGRELGTDRDKATRRKIQMVFQDPSSSLNPARTVGQTLAELLRAHDLVPPRGVKARCHQLLDLVGLPSATIDSKPRQLSGGQRQRVGIARALALEPEVLIADEAVAALDVSVQALVLNLLAELREELDLALVFISHDLSVVRHISEELRVMYMGRVVESGPTEKVFRDPRHPYTRALIAAAPAIHAPKRSGEGALTGEPPSPLELPPGCRFAPRCPLRFDRCGIEDPPLLGDADHQVACLLHGDPMSHA
jgi:oligopeptide/dipeptide ABC transporter ATP-binding protein